MLNQAPNDWTIGELITHLQAGPRTQIKGGGWQPARPFGLFGLRSRLRLAWLVFTGQADALRWPFQNPKAW